MLRKGNVQDIRTQTYGKIIRGRRKQLGRTQQDIADYVGVNRRLVSEVENGSESVSLKHLIAICEAVGLDLLITAKYRDGS